MTHTNLLSLARFAQIAGVSRQAAHKIRDRALGPAMAGKKIDANHPAAREYLRGKGKQIGTPTPQPPNGHTKPGKGAPPLAPGSRIPQEHDPTEDTPAADILRRGGIDNYLKVMQANKTAEDIKGKKILNEERQGKLVSRSFMDQYVFAALNTLNSRLLTDVPRTLARRLYSMCKADAPPEEAEAVVISLISDQLKSAKGAIDTAIQRFVKA